MWKRLASCFSNITRPAGRHAATCLQISDPIEPPAPVTMILRPRRLWPSRSRSNCTGSRNRSSSTGYSSGCGEGSLPFRMSARSGSSLTGRPEPRLRRISSRSRPSGTAEATMKVSSGEVRPRISSSWS